MDDEFSDKLYKYLPENGTFIELPGKMKLPRMDPIAILVERSIFPDGCKGGNDGSDISSVSLALMTFAVFVGRTI